MARLTKTEFKALSADAAYSAYDDAYAGVAEARSAQAAAITQAEKDAADLAAAKTAHEAALTEAVAKAVEPLNAELTTLRASLADSEAARSALEAARPGEIADAVAAAVAEARAPLDSQIVELKGLLETVVSVPEGRALAKRERIKAVEAAKLAALEAQARADAELAELNK